MELISDMFYYSAVKPRRSHNSNDIEAQLVSMRTKMINVLNDLVNGKNVKLVIHNIRNGFHKPAQRLDKAIITYEYYRHVVHSDKNIQRSLFIQIIDNCIKRLTDIEANTNEDSYYHKKEVMSYLTMQDELNDYKYLLKKGYFFIMKAILVDYMNKLLDHEIRWYDAVNEIMKRFKYEDDVKLQNILSLATDTANDLANEDDKEKCIVDALYNICFRITTGSFIISSVLECERIATSSNNTNNFHYSYCNYNKSFNIVSYWDKLDSDIYSNGVLHTNSNSVVSFNDMFGWDSQVGY